MLESKVPLALARWPPPALASRHRIRLIDKVCLTLKIVTGQTP